MRKLMWCAVGYCGALALGHYLLPYEYMLWFAMVCAVFSPLALLLKENARKIVNEVKIRNINILKYFLV